jgi:hypothetical protein
VLRDESFRSQLLEISLRWELSGFEYDWACLALFKTSYYKERISAKPRTSETAWLDALERIRAVADPGLDRANSKTY